jgi:GLTT repeat (6 copies)
MLRAYASGPKAHRLGEGISGYSPRRSPALRESKLRRPGWDSRPVSSPARRARCSPAVGRRHQRPLVVPLPGHLHARRFLTVQPRPPGSRAVSQFRSKTQRNADAGQGRQLKLNAAARAAGAGTSGPGVLRLAGLVSVGLVSVGLVSVGLVSVGLVSVGLVSVGLVSVGLVSVGLVGGAGVLVRTGIPARAWAGRCGPLTRLPGSSRGATRGGDTSLYAGCCGIRRLNRRKP